MQVLADDFLFVFGRVDLRGGPRGGEWLGSLKGSSWMRDLEARWFDSGDVFNSVSVSKPKYIQVSFTFFRLQHTSKRILN